MEPLPLYLDLHIFYHLKTSNDLEIYVTDDGSKRKVRVIGDHVNGHNLHCKQSEFETLLSLGTLRKIAARKGNFFKDEIDRSEDPNYMLKTIKMLIKEFNIEIKNKNILDFGCGAGSFGLNLLRLGATNVTGVEVDQELIDIADSRLNDFFPDQCILKKIDYIDGKYKLPFSDETFDIVWPHAVMEHVFPKHRRFVLKELFRVLKKGGHIIIDATPNRLWIKENHTSGIYLLNYLPFRLAAFIAKVFSSMVPFNQTNNELLSRGFRGITYWLVRKELDSAICLGNQYRKKDLRIYMNGIKNKHDSSFKKLIKIIYENLMSILDPIFSAFNLPQTAFLPWHIIVFKKQ